MKILFIGREDADKLFGGDVVQYSHTKEFLEKKYGCEIFILPINKVTKKDIEEADILHFWGINISPNIGRIISTAKKTNTKIVISTVFWDNTVFIFMKYFVSPFLKNNLYPWLEAFNNFSHDFVLVPLCYINPSFWSRRYYIRGTFEFSKFRKWFIKAADAIIPNSDEEGELLCREIGLDINSVREKFVSIPNAVDVEYIKNHKDNGFMGELKDFVIEAAGIEPSKNQFGVLKALMDYPEIPVVFAGAVRDEKYYACLKELAEQRGKVYFTGNISPDDLFSLYKRAKVHALPSFMDTTGLATLEALMSGVQIVVSNERFCPIKYYKFDELGFVCNPYDIKTIETAILEAYAHPKNITLSEDYLKFHSYETVANMTFEVYERMLKD